VDDDTGADEIKGHLVDRAFKELPGARRRHSASECRARRPDPGEGSVRRAPGEGRVREV
jgi:hypothetical protein